MRPQLMAVSQQTSEVPQPLAELCGFQKVDFGTDANGFGAVSSALASSNVITIQAPADLRIASLQAPTAVGTGANFTVAILLAIARQLPALGFSAPSASLPNIVSVGDLFVSGGTVTLNNAGALTVGTLDDSRASASPPPTIPPPPSTSPSAPPPPRNSS